MSLPAYWESFPFQDIGRAKNNVSNTALSKLSPIRLPVESRTFGSFFSSNAIIHNDYINGSYPVFEIYDDRLEVISTGGLLVGLTEDEFFRGLSHPRNRELMRIFSDMDLCEQLGSGMKKILRAYPKDIFDISDHFISVHFQYNKEAMAILNKQSNGGVNGMEIELSENAILVLKALEHNGKLTQPQLFDDLQMTVRTLQRALKELREKKYIEREGSDKSGQYIVLKPIPEIFPLK